MRQTTQKCTFIKRDKCNLILFVSLCNLIDRQVRSILSPWTAWMWSEMKKWYCRNMCGWLLPEYIFNIFIFLFCYFEHCIFNDLSILQLHAHIQCKWIHNIYTVKYISHTDIHTGSHFCVNTIGLCMCLDTCCTHFLTIIAGVDLHFRHAYTNSQWGNRDLKSNLLNAPDSHNLVVRFFLGHWWLSGLSKHLSDMKCAVMNWRSWVETPFGLNLGCTVLQS